MWTLIKVLHTERSIEKLPIKPRGKNMHPIGHFRVPFASSSKRVQVPNLSMMEKFYSQVHQFLCNLNWFAQTRFETEAKVLFNDCKIVDYDLQNISNGKSMMKLDCQCWDHWSLVRDFLICSIQSLFYVFALPLLKCLWTVWYINCMCFVFAKSLIRTISQNISFPSSHAIIQCGFRIVIGELVNRKSSYMDRFKIAMQLSNLHPPPLPFEPAKVNNDPDLVLRNKWITYKNYVFYRFPFLSLGPDRRSGGSF